MIQPRTAYDADAIPKQRRIYESARWLDPLLDEQMAIYKAALKRRKGKDALPKRA